MTYLRAPSGDCAYCGQPYVLHDACTDACPGEQVSRPVASDDREKLIGLYRQLVALETDRERKRNAMKGWLELTVTDSPRRVAG